VLVADDNDGGMNHRTTTCVLYDSGVRRHARDQRAAREGVIQPDEEVLVVGPESPVEELRKLSLD
jgi:hypothetical protein